METMVAINIIASVIIGITMCAFIVFVFGRKSMLDKHPLYETFAVRLGLCMVASGALFNCINITKPTGSEVVMNVGFALVFVWAAFFHYKYFVKK